MTRQRAAMAVLAAALMFGAAASAADLDIGFVGGMTGAKANTAIDQLDGFRLGVRHLGGRRAGVDDQHNGDKAKQAEDDLWKNGRLHVLLLSSTADAAAYAAAQSQGHRT